MQVCAWRVLDVLDKSNPNTPYSCPPSPAEDAIFYCNRTLNLGPPEETHDATERGRLRGLCVDPAKESGEWSWPERRSRRGGRSTL
jgi:hypothetical protein